MNKVLLTGHITAAPNSFQTKTQKALATFSIAVKENFKSKIDNTYPTHFFNCIAWNKTAEYITNYIKVGDLVSVEGSLKTRSYVNKEGKNQKVVEVNVENIELLSHSHKNMANGQGANATYHHEVQHPANNDSEELKTFDEQPLPSEENSKDETQLIDLEDIDK